MYLEEHTGICYAMRHVTTLPIILLSLNSCKRALELSKTRCIIYSYPVSGCELISNVLSLCLFMCNILGFCCSQIK